MLYVMGKSPLNTRDLEQCSNLKKASDSKVILIEDAVIAAKKGIVTEDIIDKFKKNGIAVYALKADLEARAIKDLNDYVKLIDYDGFVDLVVENKIVSCM